MGNAIYESNWTVQDKATKRTLLIMMIRTQIPLTIDVGPFIRMDAAATLTVLLTLKVVYLFMIVVFFCRLSRECTVTPLLCAKSGAKTTIINSKVNTIKFLRNLQLVLPSISHCNITGVVQCWSSTVKITCPENCRINGHFICMLLLYN